MDDAPSRIDWMKEGQEKVAIPGAGRLEGGGSAPGMTGFPRGLAAGFAEGPSGHAARAYRKMTGPPARRM
jgi:hypothetical protein